MNRCAFPVIDDKGGRTCGAPAIGTRTVHGVDFDVCAIVIDATPEDPKARRLSPEEVTAGRERDHLADLTRRQVEPAGHAKKRVVVRLDRRDVKRLDALRPRVGWPSRAALVRLFVQQGLDHAESLTKPGGATPAANDNAEGST